MEKVKRFCILLLLIYFSTFIYGEFAYGDPTLVPKDQVLGCYNLFCTKNSIQINNLVIDCYSANLTHNYNGATILETLRSTTSTSMTSQDDNKKVLCDLSFLESSNNSMCTVNCTSDHCRVVIKEGAEYLSSKIQVEFPMSVNCEKYVIKVQYAGKTTPDPTSSTQPEDTVPSCAVGKSKISPSIIMLALIFCIYMVDINIQSNFDQMRKSGNDRNTTGLH